MQITKELIESLLFEEEGTALDFKRDQYAFEGASNDQKSELLKDILAFTNAFPRTDAYILIGVEEVKGDRSKVVGVTQHLDDAKLQQFVNSKTQRPVNFSYRAAEHDGQQIGVIHIPLQNRPVHTTVNFGKVRKNDVLVRRGSATDIASPDEIAQMGADRAVTRGAEPSLEFAIYDRESGKPAGNGVSLQTILLETPSEKDIPNYDGASGGGMLVSALGINSAYYRELVEYTRLRHFAGAVSFTVHNGGEVSAQDVRLAFEVDDPAEAYSFLEQWDMPEPPERERIMSFHGPTIHDTHDVHVERIGTRWCVECHFGKIQPQGSGRLDNVLYVGAARSGTLSIDGRLSADNLGRPVPVRFDIEFEVAPRTVSLDDIEALERRRIFGSEEGDAMLDELGHAEADE